MISLLRSLTLYSINSTPPKQETRVASTDDASMLRDEEFREEPSSTTSLSSSLAGSSSSLSVRTVPTIETTHQGKISESSKVVIKRQLSSLMKKVNDKDHSEILDRVSFFLEDLVVNNCKKAGPYQIDLSDGTVFVLLYETGTLTLAHHLKPDYLKTDYLKTKIEIETAKFQVKSTQTPVTSTYDASTPRDGGGREEPSSTTSLSSTQVGSSLSALTAPTIETTRQTPVTSDDSYTPDDDELWDKREVSSTASPSSSLSGSSSSLLTVSTIEITHQGEISASCKAAIAQKISSMEVVNSVEYHSTVLNAVLTILTGIAINNISKCGPDHVYNPASDNEVYIRYSQGTLTLGTDRYNSKVEFQVKFVSAAGKKDS